jgi:hypothetical protein
MSTGDRIKRGEFGTIAVAAGIAGVALLAWPGSTPSFFSWPLGPEPAAALVGGLYVASTVTFGFALARSWVEGRGLVVASLGLTVPTLVATIVHRNVFDFSRPAAVAWLVIFASAPIAFVAMLAGLPVGATPHQRPPSPPLVRILAGLMAVAFAATAIALWVDPRGGAGWLPFAPPPMSGRFLGAWVAFVSLLAAWAAVRPASEARVAGIGLASFGVGAVAGGLREAGALDPAGRVVAFFVVWAIVAIAGAVTLRASQSVARSDGAGLTSTQIR